MGRQTAGGNERNRLSAKRWSRAFAYLISLLSGRAPISWESNGIANSNINPTAGHDATAGEPILEGEVKPVFKKELRELWVGRDCVHFFRAQACNEVAILRKLQEKNWPPVIFEPLGNSKSRKYAWLRTVCRLNQSQSPWLIQFHSHCSERAVSWKWTLPRQQPNCNH